MGKGITTELIVGFIVIAHFLFGIGYLIYKLNGPVKEDKTAEQEIDDID